VRKSPEVRPELANLAGHVIAQRRSSPEMVAEVLRDAILRGVLRSGQVLRQDDIAAQFGVSRIPVREALRQLEGQGLVTFRAHRSITVSELSVEELREICEIRVALETAAIRMAIPHLTEDVLDRAGEILNETDREDEVVGHWSENNWRFHATLYEPAHRPHLLAMIQSLHNNVDRYLRLHVSLLNYRRRGQQEHWQILAACRRRDIPEAERLLAEHIKSVGDLLSTYLDHRPGDEAAG
jgi:DNA-binding GntR family transcriptional regulator